MNGSLPIIGPGPTGAVAAERLAEAGKRVVVLDQGGWPDYRRARADHPDFELTAGRDWSANPNRRQAPADYPVSDNDFGVCGLAGDPAFPPGKGPQQGSSRAGRPVEWRRGHRRQATLTRRILHGPS